MKKWNLLTDDFETAWNDYASLLKERASKNNKCLKCKYLMMCSPCVVVNYLSTGDYNKPAEGAERENAADGPSRCSNSCCYYRDGATW